MKQQLIQQSKKLLTCEQGKIIKVSAKMRKNYLENWCEAKRNSENTQKNKCVSLIRKEKLDYCNKLDRKKIFCIGKVGKNDKDIASRG